MPLPNISPLVIDQFIVVMSATFMECFNADEQDVIGNFFATLGGMLSLNSSYILLQQSLIEDNNQKDSDETNQDSHYDLLEKSIDKMKEEIEKLKNKNVL
ncbi:MAG: hypothetical protein ACLUVC_13440 [Longibaculum sp.]